MEMFIAGLTVKMLLSGVLWVMVQNTTAAYANPDPDAGPGMAFLLPLVVAMLTIEVASNVVFISIIAFFSKISDPSIGGSYMTLLNTLTNLGSKWITSLSLYLLPKMTFYACEVSTTAGQEMLEGEPSKLPLPYACSAHDDTQCVQHGGSCVIELVRQPLLQNFTLPVCHLIIALDLGWLYRSSCGGVGSWSIMAGFVQESRAAVASPATHRLAHFVLKRKGEVDFLANSCPVYIQLYNRSLSGAASPLR
jgi:hypothetical protein